jgi:hypothetical protein
MIQLSGVCLLTLDKLALSCASTNILGNQKAENYHDRVSDLVESYKSYGV